MVSGHAFTLNGDWSSSTFKIDAPLAEKSAGVFFIVAALYERRIE